MKRIKRKKEEEAPIKDNESEDQPVLNLNTQRASSPPQNKRGKLLRNIDAHLKSSTQKDSTSIAYLRPWRNLAGTVCSMQKATCCGFESDQTIPETLTESVSFTVEVSSMKWNCLLGNTMNTIVALGHLPSISSAEKDTVMTRALSSTRLPDTQTVNLQTVAYALKVHGYNTAITRKGICLDFSFLQKYANNFRLHMLVLLRMVYPLGSIKFHIIGIVPVTIDSEIHMHIVEGCHPEKKTIALNKPNLIWCCGEWESYSVYQFVAFVLGEKAVKKLKASIKCNTTDHHKQMYFEYADVGKTLSESIPSISPQYTKRKRL